MADLTCMMQAAAGSAGGGAGPSVQEVFSTTLYTGNGTAQSITNDIALDDDIRAKPEDTTASSLRSGRTVPQFFCVAQYGVFNSVSAGENLVVDFGSDVEITSATYRNAVGGDWAPTEVLIQSSPDNSTWTTRATYSDDNTSNVQTITVSGAASARYWRIYQNTNTRQNSPGYEWHMSHFSMTSPISGYGQGGMVWIKSRSNSNNHALGDTVRGPTKIVLPNLTNGQLTNDVYFPAYNYDGFNIEDGAGDVFNVNTYTYVSWTFRKATKFFDVVTFTANADGSATVSHNLGSVPGFTITKRIDSTSSWIATHRSLGNTGEYLILNGSNAELFYSGFGVVSDTQITYSAGSWPANSQLVVYLFAHDDGGFGSSGTDNVISCGGYTGNGSATGPTVSLGYEPQWLMIKRTDSAGNWVMYDSKRDVSNPRTAYLLAETTDAEQTGNDVDFNATSFQLKSTNANINASGGTYVYIAVRADM